MHGLVPAAGRDPNPMPIRHPQLAIPSTMTTVYSLDHRTRDGRKGILSAIPIFRDATQMLCHADANTTYHIQRFPLSFLRIPQTM